MKNETCSSCTHFGEVRLFLENGAFIEYACLAPITTDAEAKNKFVYRTDPHGCCELYQKEDE